MKKTKVLQYEEFNDGKPFTLRGFNLGAIEILSQLNASNLPNENKLRIFVAAGLLSCRDLVCLNGKSIMEIDTQEHIEKIKKVIFWDLSAEETMALVEEIRELNKDFLSKMETKLPPEVKKALGSSNPSVTSTNTPANTPKS